MEHHNEMIPLCRVSAKETGTKLVPSTGPEVDSKIRDLGTTTVSSYPIEPIRSGVIKSKIILGKRVFCIYAIHDSR